MPCYGMRKVQQTLENITDINLLAAALEEMGLKTRVIAQTIAFSGVDSKGQYQSGSYANGKLTTQQGMDLGLLKKYTAIANLKKQVAANNADKYKKTKLTMTKVSEFNYKVTKQ
jgi:hypothetical protein